MQRYKLPEWTDELLLEQVRDNDDRAAFAELYNRYWKLLVDAAFQRLKVRQAAEEMVQDLFVDFFVRRREITPKSSVRAYFRTALRNQVFRYYHVAQSQSRGLVELMSEGRHDPSVPDELLEAKQLQAKIGLIADRLPEKCREVFMMSRFEHLSHQEIADKLGISVSTVKKHITKALTVLRQEVGDHHLDLLAFLLFAGFYA